MLFYFSEETPAPTVTGQVTYAASYAEMLSKPVPQRRGIVNYVGNFSGIKVPAILKVLGFANNVYQKYTDDQNTVLDQMASDIHRF